VKGLVCAEQPLPLSVESSERYRDVSPTVLDLRLDGRNDRRQARVCGRCCVAGKRLRNEQGRNELSHACSLGVLRIAHYAGPC
jgi:hypothetical protein